ncbi:MAG: hypothetical protein ACXWJC_05995 [Croceibacterium sp.]
MAPAWVSVVALAGWLMLSVSALRARKLKAGRAVVYGLAWAAIFLGVSAVFAAMI